MKIYSVYIINKSGGLIYNLDNLEAPNDSISSVQRTVLDKTVTLPITLKLLDERVMVYKNYRNYKNINLLTNESWHFGLPGGF